MNDSYKSSSTVQVKAEEEIIALAEKELKIVLEKQKKLCVNNDKCTFIHPDFYSEEPNVIGEVFAHIGKLKKAQSNKIANDILKMLTYEESTGKKYRKIIVVCDEVVKTELEGKSVLSESIRLFNIEVLLVDIDASLRQEILNAQTRQKMTNV